MMRKFAVAPTEIGSIVMRSSGFDAPAEHLTSIYPLLYQSGYLTIKDYNPISKLYTLDIPNQEIRIGLMESLLPNYVSNETVEGQTTISQMCEHIIYDRLDEALKLLKAYLLTVPQCDNTNYEGHYQQLLYVLFSLLGYEVDVEVRTDKGRIDIVMRTDYAIYLMEVKINKTAVRARKQIDVKRYGDRFALEKRPIIKVGINFSTDKHTLTGWVIDDPRKA